MTQTAQPRQWIEKKDPRIGLPILRTSATELDEFERCNRYWHHTRQQGKKVRSAAMGKGSAVHAIIEDYLLRGKEPETSHEWARLFAAVKPHLPDPSGNGTPKCSVCEQTVFSTGGRYVYHLEPGGEEACEGSGAEVPAGLETRFLVEHEIDMETFPGGPHFVGKVDLLFLDEDVPHILDTKTTSDFRYAKTPEKLANNTQLLAYAFWRLFVAKLPGDERRDLSKIRLSHLYARTRGAPKALPVFVEVSREHVAERWAERIETIRTMTSLVSVVSAEDLEPNTEACGQYGGCAFRRDCGFEGADPFDRLPDPVTPKKETPAMSTESSGGGSLLDRLRKKNPVPPAAAETSKPAETAKEEPAAPPKNVNIVCGVEGCKDSIPAAEIAAHRKTHAKPVEEKAAPEVVGLAKIPVTACEIGESYLLDPKDGPREFQGSSTVKSTGAKVYFFAGDEGAPPVKLAADAYVFEPARETAPASAEEAQEPAAETKPAGPTEPAKGVVPPDAPARTHSEKDAPAEEAKAKKTKKKATEAQGSLPVAEEKPKAKKEPAATKPVVEEKAPVGPKLVEVDPLSDGEKLEVLAMLADAPQPFGDCSDELYTYLIGLEKDGLVVCRESVFRLTDAGEKAHETKSVAPVVEEKKEETKPVAEKAPEPKKEDLAGLAARESAKPAPAAKPDRKTFVLFVDVVQTKGAAAEAVSGDELMAPLVETVCEAHGVADWRLMKYGEGKAHLASLLRKQIPTLPERIAISSFSAHSEVLFEVLTPHARAIYKAAK